MAAINRNEWGQIRMSGKAYVLSVFNWNVFQCITNHDIIYLNHISKNWEITFPCNQTSSSSIQRGNLFFPIISSSFFTFCHLWQSCDLSIHDRFVTEEFRNNFFFLFVFRDRVVYFPPGVPRLHWQRWITVMPNGKFLTENLDQVNGCEGSRMSG